MGGRRACLPPCGFNHGRGLGVLLLVVSSCVLGCGLYIFFCYYLKKKKGRMQQLSGCAVHFQTHPKGGEIFPFAIIPPLRTPERSSDCFKSYRTLLFTSS